MLNTKTITIKTGKDAGKTFQITEMPVGKADLWARRIALGVMRSGMRMTNVDLINFQTMDGLLELLKFGVTAFGYLDEELAIELTDELLSECVMIVPSNGTPRKLVDGDILRVKTFMQLRLEAFKVHEDFLDVDDSSN